MAVKSYHFAGEGERRAEFFELSGVIWQLIHIRCQALSS